MPALPRQPAFAVQRSDFPDDFIFGSSTSAYQIEGSSFGGCGPSHWDSFCASPGNVRHFDNGAIACDHYHRWPEDLDLIKAAGLQAYRFSASWARVMPEGKGAVNQQGLDFYDSLVDGLLERGLDPHLTLYHWELPSALADIGGWTNRDVTDHFADFAEIMTKRLGDRLKSVATFNEPWCVSWLSYYLGLHAPGLRDIRMASRSAHLVLVAHAKAMAAMRALGQDNLGIVCNFEDFAPADNSAEALEATKLAESFYNGWFVGGIFKGAYPALAIEQIEPHLPAGWQDDLAQIAAPIDWLGINYYTRSLIRMNETKPGAALPAFEGIRGDRPRTAMDNEVYPEGLENVLVWLKETHTGETPLVVAENGMANDDHLMDGAVDDQERIAYLDAHFARALSAIERGVPLKAYFVWSLMDNFEWSFGYDMRFGLIHVDFESLKRTPKASYHALQAMLHR